jgi:hypothetical protein
MVNNYPAAAGTEVVLMAWSENRNRLRDSAVAVGYVVALGTWGATLGTIADGPTSGETVGWLFLVVAVVLSYTAGHLVGRFWILAVPGALAAATMAFVFWLLSNGFPSYDNDQMLALYALVLPFVMFAVLGAPMALGVFIGRRDEEPDV